jgi:two-component sensor histidine kinase
MNIDDLYRLLRSGHIQAQGIVDTIPDPLVILDASLCVQSASRAFFETFHVDRFETIGRPIYELGNGQWDIPDLRRLLTEVLPRATAVVNYEVEHDFPDLGQRTMLVTARTLAHPDNNRQMMLLSIIDATDRVRREATKDMLFAELRHRVKNLLAVAQAIARHTQTEGRTAEEYRDDFLGRFRALTNAHEVAFGGLSESGLRQLLEHILAPYATPEAVKIQDHDDVELGPSTMVALSLILHELTTNAAKYGALSSHTGQVDVSWHKDPVGQDLKIFWKEKGGPKVVPPEKQGYGARLIDSSMRFSLGGQVEQTYAEDGLQVTMVVPLKPEQDREDAANAKVSADR